MNLSDCRAQIAANERGRSLLAEMIERYGTETVVAYVGYTLDNAEESVRGVLDTVREEFGCGRRRGGDLIVQVSVGLSQEVGHGAKFFRQW